MLYFILFLFGITIGSFLNVCIYRIPRKQSIAYPPSHCTACKSRLRPIDLIPLLSYMLLRGKCGYCGGKVSPQYPMVELANGLLYITLFHIYGFSLNAIIYALLISVLLVISIIDYSYYKIPDGLNGLIILLGVVYLMFNKSEVSMMNHLLGLVVGGGLFLLISIISKGAMGGGDIKLMGSLGLLFGWQKILVIALLAFNIGAIMSIIMIVCKIKNKKDTIPFGPFIAVSAYIVLVYGTQIMAWILP